MGTIRYRNGLIVEGMYCSFCGARRTGRIFQEKARWMAKLECGHISFKGWVRDPATLEAEGLVNPKTERDPRAVSIERQREEDRRLQAIDRLQYEMKKAGYPVGQIREEVKKLEREFARAEIRRG
jgi:hypothetical protein